MIVDKGRVVYWSFILLFITGTLTFIYYIMQLYRYTWDTVWGLSIDLYFSTRDYSEYTG